MKKVDLVSFLLGALEYSAIHEAHNEDVGDRARAVLSCLHGSVSALPGADADAKKIRAAIERIMPRLGLGGAE